MRFLMVMIPAVYQSDNPPAAPDPATVAEMSKYNESLADAGVLLSLDGLHPTNKASRVHFAAGRKPTITDGPFSEAKEVIGGFWLIQASSLDEATEWARRCPAEPGDIIEVRQIFETAG